MVETQRADRTVTNVLALTLTSWFCFYSSQVEPKGFLPGNYHTLCEAFTVRNIVRIEWSVLGEKKNNKVLIFFLHNTEPVHLEDNSKMLKM